MTESLHAQTPPPQPPAQRPVILDTPSSGRITDAPAAPTAVVSEGTIERFEVVGNTSVASDTIRVYLGIVPGEAYNPAEIQKNFSNLWQTGLFDDIKVESEPGETGVVVRAIVVERSRIGSVEYRGNKELNTTKVNEVLEREKIDLHIGSTMDQTLIRRAAEAIKMAYAEGGFEGVSVDPLVEDIEGAPGEKKVVFHINEGIKAKVASIIFDGNKRFSDGKLRSVMKEVKRNNPISWIRKKNLYIPNKLDEDLERLKNYYQDYGYYDITFGEPKVETLRGRKPRVRLTIPVKEGTVHKFGEVSVEGNTVFTNEQIIGDWPFKKGETIRRKPIQNRVDAFGEAYRGRGYIYAYVNPEYIENEEGIVDVKIQVFEGDQFRLGRLEFQGNTTTKDKVLRREIFLEEGQIMDMETFKQSIYKLGQLGYFKVTDNPDFKVNQENKTVDIVVKGVEEGKNDIQFGGGYTEGGGFFVQTQFATRNFLGEGENFSLGYQHGSRTDFFSIAYADPWFLDTPNSLGFSVYNRSTVPPASFGYQARARGGTLAYGYRVGRFDSISMLYGLERSRIHYESQERPDPNGNVPISDVQDFVFTQSSIAPTYRYDSRDNPYDSARGMRFNVGAQYSGGALGGSIDMLKPTIGLTKFFRLSRRTSLSVNVEGGWIVPLRDDCSNSYEERTATGLALCVPEQDRFIVGGEYSVRGFEYGTLGPFETLSGGRGPVGGYKYHVYNFEHITRLNEPLRLVLFGDAGYAYAHEENFDFSKLRYSAGVELRIFLPVFQFPLRFIYAINLQEKPEDEFTAFSFTIGNTF
jgi:outer membrane protein insertion porin family